MTQEARPHRLVVLFDVDNTLLDNDRFQNDLRRHIARDFGPETTERYWAIFEQLRNELGYADYLGALQRYRLEALHNPKILRMSDWLMEYDFPRVLYPGALEVVDRMRTDGSLPVILSDGDAAFQPRKVVRSGLWQAFRDNVLIYVHKEQELDDVERFYPADHYFLVDDKLRILDNVKQQWGDRVTTVFPRQGHYAQDPETLAKYPPADISIDRISDLLTLDLSAFGL